MVVVTVELWPKGVEAAKRKIGEARISNLCTGSTTVGNYKYTLSDKSGTRRYKEGEVTNFPRSRLLVWDLLFRVLESAVGYKNPHEIVDYNHNGSHSHDWKPQLDGDFFCPICGGWKSQIDALLQLERDWQSDSRS